MNRKDREYFANERFYNRRIGVWEAVVEAVGVAVLATAWIIICAVA